MMASRFLRRRNLVPEVYRSCPQPQCLGSIESLRLFLTTPVPRQPLRNAPSPQPPSRCWRCGSLKSHSATPTCSSPVLANRRPNTDQSASGEGGMAVCGAIQPLSPWTTYFDVFADVRRPNGRDSSVRGIVSSLSQATSPSISEGFDIDLVELKRRFLELQQAVHPDGHTQKSEEEKRYSDMQSSFINKAYQTLKIPLLRARYLLFLNDVHIEEGESLKDPEILVNIMEVYESLDTVTSEEQLRALKAENDERIAKTLKAISDSFKTGDLVTAKMKTMELQYWDNLREKLEDFQIK